MATPRDAEIQKDVQVPAVGPVVAVEHRLSGDIRPLEARPGLPGFLGWGQGHIRAWSFTGSKGRPGLSGLEWGWWGAGALPQWTPALLSASLTPPWPPGQTYYGQVLKKSADLQTNACVTAARPVPQHIREALQNVHEEVSLR